MDVKDILARVKAKKEKKRLKPEDRLPYWERQDGKDHGTPEAAEHRKRGRAGTMLDAMLAAGYITPDQHHCGARLHFLFKVRFAAVWERDPRQRDDQEKLEAEYRENVRTMGNAMSRLAIKAAVFDEPAPCREALQALVLLRVTRPSRTKQHRDNFWRAPGAAQGEVGESRVVYIKDHSMKRKRR